MYQREFDAAFYIIKKAADVIRDGYFSTISISYKEDKSPVTDIDKKVDALIKEYLLKEFPNYGILTEESEDDLSRLSKDYVWIIDPIDGTQEFITHKYEFVTNIALAYKGEIVLALINVPLKDECYYAIKGEGAFLVKGNKKEAIHVSNISKDIRVLSSPYHMSEQEKEYLEKHKDKFSKISFAGAAYKACLIASGQAEASYRFTLACKEWDIAPCDLLLEEAGGFFFGVNGEKYTYNKENVKVLHGFIMLNLKENYF